MKMNDKMYNMLKWLAMYLLPAMGTLYFALSGIWGLPYGEQIVGTITAADTFLGVLLGLSASQYNKASDGTLEIDTNNPEKDTYRLNIATPLEDLKDKTTLTLNIDNTANLSGDTTSQK